MYREPVKILEMNEVEDNCIHSYRVSFRILAKGVKMRCNGILGGGGAKWYDLPGSKAYGKLGDPGIIIC